ncbi:MAG: hypothetical protein ACTSRC_19660 [Candidatus Helarchaeota archaeon]
MKKINIKYHPTIPEHRIKALLEEYNSERDECPFFVDNDAHFCLIDFHSVHIENCHGHCFYNGFCCPIINDLLFEKPLDDQKRERKFKLKNEEQK